MNLENLKDIDAKYGADVADLYVEIYRLQEKRKELDTYFAEIKVEQEKILKEQAAAEEEKKK